MSTYVVNVLLDFFSELFYDNGFDPDSYINRNLKEKSEEKYNKVISEIKQVLKGDIKDLINRLEKKMMIFSSKMDFEKCTENKRKDWPVKQLSI